MCSPLIFCMSSSPCGNLKFAWSSLKKNRCNDVHLKRKHSQRLSSPSRPKVKMDWTHHQTLRKVGHIHRSHAFQGKSLESKTTAMMDMDVFSMFFNRSSHHADAKICLVRKETITKSCPKQVTRLSRPISIWTNSTLRLFLETSFLHYTDVPGN